MRTLLFPLLLIASQALAAPPVHECRWVDGPIVIDGKADEAAWKHAEVVDRFTLPWLGERERPARTATKARLLWDREAIYFHAEMEDADLYAYTRERDGKLWLGDVFELFFKPSEEHGGYYEFQVNPSGAVLDIFMPRRGAGAYDRFADDRPFAVEAKVALDGTLGKWTDRDGGWSVEGRIPWTDFLATGGRPKVGETWRYALCRYDYSVDFEGPELSTCAPLSSKRFPDFHHFEDYALLKFVGADETTAARPFGIDRRTPLTTSRVIGSPEPPPPYRVVRRWPNLELTWPIQIGREPGTRGLLIADEDRPWGKSRILRTSADPAELDVLLSVTDTIYDFCFHPKYERNGHLFVGSNGSREGGPKMSRVTRYTVGSEKPHRIDPKSALVVVEWESDGHNGAAVAFGNDGYLYVTSGDGTSDSDTNVVGQGLDHLLGKVLRLDVENATAERPYEVPKDNPFVGKPNARPETWAYGLRNPWRITVDRATGDVWVGNNGQDLWEQVYRVERGDNFGWSVFEGSHEFYPLRELGPTPVSKPTLEHSHAEARSLTGGVVYTGKRFPELRGAYVYGDYSTGKIWAAKHDGEKIAWHREIADTTLQVTGFCLDADGELLICDHRKEGAFYAFERNGDPGYDPAKFPRHLSETGLFEPGGHRPMKALVPYSVNSPLWSDGASKARFIAIPESSGENGEPPRIGFSPTKAWEFPDGTVLVKSFALDLEGAKETWVETRLLVRQQGEWVGYSYEWNDEQTDAVLVEKTGRDRTFRVSTAEGVREQAWRYPSRTECMVCHSRAAGFVLGLNTWQMNRDHDYGGRRDNQLRVLEHLGLLRVDWRKEAVDRLKEKEAESKQKEAAARTATRDQRDATPSSLLALDPSDYDRLVDPYDTKAPLEDRVRSYLHANCAQCHVQAGGGNSQFDVGFGTPLAKAKLVDFAPVHHTFGLRDAKLVAAGDPDRSVLLHRIETRGRGRMPQLATSVVDEKAVSLFRRWIRQLDPPSTP